MCLIISLSALKVKKVVLSSENRRNDLSTTEVER
jgi:hypothetical protein